MVFQQWRREKKLQNGEEIGQIGEEGCKYFGVLEKEISVRRRWEKTLGKNTLRG